MNTNNLEATVVRVDLCIYGTKEDIQDGYLWVRNLILYTRTGKAWFYWGNKERLSQLEKKKESAQMTSPNSFSKYLTWNLINRTNLKQKLKEEFFDLETDIALKTIKNEIAGGADEVLSGFSKFLGPIDRNWLSKLVTVVAKIYCIPKL